MLHFMTGANAAVRGDRIGVPGAVPDAAGVMDTLSVAYIDDLHAFYRSLRRLLEWRAKFPGKLSKMDNVLVASGHTLQQVEDAFAGCEGLQRNDFRVVCSDYSDDWDDSVAACARRGEV